MELDKRNYTKFDEFQGYIDDDNSYKFPSLYHIDTNNNTRIWTIQIRLIKNDIKKHKINWNLLIDNTIPIIPKYLTGHEVPEGTIAQIYVETGVISGKITRHIPTYATPKNEGKKNKRNSFEQALVSTRSQYLKKVENGFAPENEFKVDITHKKKYDKNIRYFPMLVRKYNDEKDKLTYPLFVQAKLDGARCVIYLNKEPNKNTDITNVIMYTRQKKEFFGFENIKRDILPVLMSMWDEKNKESVYIDGELYKHGLSLQDISGAVRNPNRDNIDKYKGIKFHIFDIFYPHNLSIKFKDRLKCMTENISFCNKSTSESKNIECVPTILIKTEEDQDDLYHKLLGMKYEGIILRNMDSLYLTHPTSNNLNIRSKYVLKRKMVYSDEFEVVDFIDGKRGRDKDAILWICKSHLNDKLFNATPKDTTYKDRYALFKDCSIDDNFNNKYKGRMMTIEYEDLSDSGIPLRAKSVGFREHL